jgi:CRP/FNR family transcriptional regulator
MLTMSLYSGESHSGLEGAFAKKSDTDVRRGVEGISNSTLRRLEPREHVCREGEAKLYEALSAELTAARDLLATVGTRSATERLASFLIALARRNERGGFNSNRIVLPMLRSDIADFLSLTVETVSRTFTRLKQRGIIDLPQSTLVIINDRDELEQVAGLTQQACA